MNTPAHLIFGAAAFARPDAPRVTAAAICGALLPDVSLYTMVAWSIWVRGIEPRVVFDEYYFSDAWQSVFAIDNSFILWVMLLLAGFAARSRVVMTFAAAGLLHLAFDFPLHHDDARAHFWPLTDWIFRSPLSYWDQGYFGHIVGPVEVAASLGLSILLWRRFHSVVARLLIVVTALLEVAPTLMFRMMM